MRRDCRWCACSSFFCYYSTCRDSLQAYGTAKGPAAHVPLSCFRKLLQAWQAGGDGYSCWYTIFIVPCCCAVALADRWPTSPLAAYRSIMREGLTNSGEASGQNWLADGLVSLAWQVGLKLSDCSNLQQHDS